jgi:hypothetical protein
MAQYGDGFASLAIFFWKKGASEKRANSQHREVVGGHVSGGNTFRTILVDDFRSARTRPIRREGQLLKRVRPKAPIGKITWRNEFLIETLRGIPFPKNHYTTRIPIGQWAQKNASNEAEDGRIGGDYSSVLYIPFRIKERVA